MLYVSTDPALSEQERSDRFLEVSRELHAAARARVESDLDPDGLELARQNGVVADGVARLVRTRGHGRLTVDPDLYGALSSDDGLVVTGWDDDADLSPASADLPAAARSFEGSSDDGAPRKAAAKKSPAKKSPAKKAPAKKAAVKKSTKKAAPRSRN